MKLLLIEDDLSLATFMKKQLMKDGFAVDMVHTGENGAFEASEQTYDCIVLDINLPDMTGFDVCKLLRDKGVETPILMLTARSAIEDRVKGLNLGADDYVAKPFDSLELTARVNALIRRNHKITLPILKIDDLTIDPAAHSVTRKGRKITLNAKEFAVAEFLARHSDEVVTRTMIMEHVWGSDYETLSNVVDVHIRNLRKKIDKPGQKSLIHTVRGTGYLLSDKQ